METASQPDVHLWDWLANRHAADGPLQSWRGDQRLPTESAVNSLPYGPDGTGLPGRPRDHFGGLYNALQQFCSAHWVCMEAHEEVDGSDWLGHLLQQR